MPNLPSRRSETEILGLQQGSIGRRRMPPQVRRATELGVAIEHGRAIVQAARVRGLERVAEEAMHITGALAREESFWVRIAPHAAGRLQAIADIAAMGAADIVADMGRD
jgi:hypothetical protein